MKVLVSRLAAATIGMSREDAALLIALGLTLGVFPIPWGPTILCLVASLVLRVKPAALQIVNQIATPAQFALAIPFARIGAFVLTPRTGLGGVVAQAVAGWVCVCVPIGIGLYVILLRGIAWTRRPLAAGSESPA